MFGFQHWNLEPDIITLAKTLSGGYVPLRRDCHTTRHLPEDIQSHGPLCRALHNFGRNTLAMVCGLASLDVIDNEKLVESSPEWGRC